MVIFSCQKVVEIGWNSHLYYNKSCRELLQLQLFNRRNRQKPNILLNFKKRKCKQTAANFSPSYTIGSNFLLCPPPLTEDFFIFVKNWNKNWGANFFSEKKAAKWRKFGKNGEKSESSRNFEKPADKFYGEIDFAPPKLMKKTCQQRGEGVKNPQNSVNVIFECPLWNLRRINSWYGYLWSCNY